MQDTGPDAGFVDAATPDLVVVNYIALDHVQKISRFRSSVGHDYSDANETCRSMKHYFAVPHGSDSPDIEIYAPVDGTIIQLEAEMLENGGTQVRIRSSADPDLVFIIFHVEIDDEIEVDDNVMAGQRIGQHIGDVTDSDIAVGDWSETYTLISYIELLNDSAFAELEALGVPNRDVLIVSREARDAAPLTCDGEQFTSAPDPADWIELTH